MKKTIAMALALAAFSSGLMAEWMDAGSNNNFTSYADPTSIRKSGMMVKMWSLMDFKKETQPAVGQPFRSIKSQGEYDCKGERTRILYSNYFNEKMGSGDVLSTSRNPTQWEPVSPESVANNLWKFACGKH